MTPIDVTDAQLASILVLDRPAAPDAPLRVVARLRDGRSFSLDLLTLSALQQRLQGAQSLVSPRLMLVREPSEAAIVEAVRAALAQGIERFGVLDAPLGE